MVSGNLNRPQRTASTTNFMKIRQAIVELLNACLRMSLEKRWSYVSFSWMRLCKMRDVHALTIRGNGVIIIPPHDFKQPLRLCYQMCEDKMYDFGIVTRGMTSKPNFIKIFDIRCSHWTEHIIGAAQVMLLMRMRRGRCLIVSSSYRITNSCISHADITGEKRDATFAKITYRLTTMPNFT